MTDNEPLVERVRDVLAAEPSLREVAMFGGRAFMVNDKMVVHVDKSGDLLVRADPARAAELLARPGARPAQMGPGRAMGNSWITVDRASAAADLDGWIEVALAYHDQLRAGRPSSS